MRFGICWAGEDAKSEQQKLSATKNGRTGLTDSLCNEHPFPRNATQKMRKSAHESEKLDIKQTKSALADVKD